MMLYLFLIVPIYLDLTLFYIQKNHVYCSHCSIMCNSTSNRSSSLHAAQRSADSFSPLQVGWALLVLFEPGAKAQDDGNTKYLPSQYTLHVTAFPSTSWTDNLSSWCPDSKKPPQWRLGYRLAKSPCPWQRCESSLSLTCQRTPKSMHWFLQE